MSRWFRLYDDVVDDPKVQRLTAPLFKFWVNCLCLASANGGEMPPLVDMAFKLRMSEKQVAENLQKLVDAELVDSTDGMSTPHNWNGRQFKSDDSKDRVQKHRQRQKKQDVTVTETENVTANVTPPETEQRQSRDRAEQKVIALRAPAAPAKAKRVRRSLPDEFPLPSDLDWSCERWKGAGRADLCDAMTEEIQKFRDHHTSKATASADWSASWRTWAGNAMKFNNKPNGNGYGLRGKLPTANDKNLAGAAIAIASFGPNDDQCGEAEVDRDAGEPVLPLLDARFHTGTGRGPV
jgi:hypothetical protein